MLSPKESCVDEIEPLRTSASLSVADSNFSSISRRKPDYARRCILVLLINAVFVLAIFLSFLIGHWISEERTKGGIDQKQLIYVLTTESPSNLTTTNHLSTLLSTRNTKPTVTWVETTTVHTVERIIPLGAEQKKFTIYDVHPPEFESYEFMEELHGTGRSKRDSLLVPLPLHVIPLHYDLLLDLSQFATHRTVRGNLTVHMESYGNSTYDEIWFNIGPNVHIERIRITREGQRVYPKRLKREDDKKLARIILKERLRRGKYFLDIEYNTTICNEENEGVHCYFDAQGPNKTVRVTSFTTKFEPTLARSFMPCWDEPGVKATFNVSVLHPAHFTVLSNMPLVSHHGSRRERETNPDRIVTSSFEETPPMSTYLLAFAVGDFEAFEMRTERNIPLTIWTLREDFLSARFAANFAPLIFDKHEEELAIPYPLPKMDFVAARSFPVGGMENWGLVIFDYQSLLLDHSLEDNVNMTVDRLFQEYKIEKIITHELSHQWFGNLVTMRDWSDLWLNEGFASYFVYDLLHEDHARITENEYYARLARLVRKQSGSERLSLVRELRTEGAVEQSFHSTHLYTKGCVLVKMIRDLVSDYDFRSGVRRYLRRNAFRSVSREDLWAALPAHADHGADHERLSHIMEGWLVNPGIPEVFVQRSYENNMIHVTQRPAIQHHHRFYLENEKFDNRLSTRDVQPPASILSRSRRDTDSLEDTTPFDDSLFDDMPEGWKTHPGRRKANRKRKKVPRPTKPRPPAGVLIQSRAVELRQPRKTRAPSDLWSIPFSYMFGSVKSTEGQVVRQFWLKNRTLSFADIELAGSQALIANPDWVYPYRVNYDHTNWKMIARMLHQNHEEVPVKSRMQLIVDSEMFLGQSDLPHLYFYLLGYLKEETDLGVALLGLDAVHRALDLWRGSSVVNQLLLYLSPVVSRFDQLLIESQMQPQLAALWLIEPTRLSKLYQLRCVTNLDSCDQDNQARQWSLYPSSSHSDIHKQMTAVCHYLYTKKGDTVAALLESQLKSRGAQWSSAVQLAACASDNRTSTLAAKQIVATKNAAIFASSLQSDFSLHYNGKFRSALWRQIGKLPQDERILLFSTNQSTPMPASKILLHSARTVEELRQMRTLVPDWGGHIGKHMEFMDKQLQWIENMSKGILSDFFNGDAFL